LKLRDDIEAALTRRGSELTRIMHDSGPFLHVRRSDACRRSVWEIGVKQLVMQRVQG
jgi:hypothetical protein